MHRAKHLAEDVFQAPDDRLLVTTFTKDLASDLAQTLQPQNFTNREAYFKARSTWRASLVAASRSAVDRAV